MLLGWRLWEWPSVLVEAEFHAVWRMKDGNLQDPTPNQWKEPKIRFVHDSNAERPEEYAYPCNILEPLVDDELVVRLVELLRKKNSAESKGDMVALQRTEEAMMPLNAQVSKRFGAEPGLDRLGS